MRKLRQYLLGGDDFRKLANAFVEEAVAEHPDDPEFQEFFRLAMQAISEENADEVDDLAQSPIEKTFLNSLILSFIKNDGLGLLIHRTFDDAAAEVKDFRKYLSNYKEFLAWFNENKPNDGDMDAFLDDKLKKGKMCQDERDYFIRLNFRYRFIPMDDSYHMTLQPKFPNVKIDGKPIRPDIYFWIPSKPEINIIVECDGFDYHSDKERFKNDRQRDRALKALGYDVFRFSGSEIIADPVGAPYELAKYLWQRAGAYEQSAASS